jgi:hypothetical protein
VVDVVATGEGYAVGRSAGDMLHTTSSNETSAAIAAVQGDR